jgi:hypothetical protein
VLLRSSARFYNPETDILLQYQIGAHVCVKPRATGLVEDDVAGQSLAMTMSFELARSSKARTVSVGVKGQRTESVGQPSGDRPNGGKVRQELCYSKEIDTGFNNSAYWSSVHYQGWGSES